MIVTIKSKLLEHLSNIDSLASVYDYHVASPESYPCATFECESIENLVQDSCNHNIKYTFDTFIVVLIDEITDRSTARGILDTVVDEIIDETNKNYTL